MVSVQAFAYAAERGAPAGGRAGLAAVSRSGGGLPAKAPAAAWDLQKVSSPARFEPC